MNDYKWVKDTEAILQLLIALFFEFNNPALPCLVGWEASAYYAKINVH